jgi:hypothetical protein
MHNPDIFEIFGRYANHFFINEIKEIDPHVEAAKVAQREYEQGLRESPSFNVEELPILLEKAQTGVSKIEQERADAVELYNQMFGEK